VTRGVGILATACVFPASTRTVADIFASEHVEPSEGMFDELGIASVHVSDTESGADLALAAVSDALGAASVSGKELDLILDYSVLPQHYLVPIWNLGNKLQHELEATNAFTLGFSGGGTSNFHVALRFATSLISADDRIRTAMLFGVDIAIPDNRVINRDCPVTVLGDGASALVLAVDAERDTVLGTEVISNGSYHDVCHIPGGALAQLDREDRSELYRLRLDTTRFAAARTADTLKELGRRALLGAGLDETEVRHHIFPNLSAKDRAAYRAVWDAPASSIVDANLERHGHVQGTDLVLNLQSAIAAGDWEDDDVVLVGSHGMGFTAGVTLLRH
jgi:3-oxoacyl-[acyl-carrier-protein] synthase III